MENNTQQIRVGLVQQACTADFDTNMATTREGVAACASQGASLIILQELHTSLYFCQQEQTELFDLAEPIRGRTFNALAQMAKAHQVVIVGSIFERRSSAMFHNTAIVVEQDGSLAGFYRKMHIPDDPGYYEKYYFTPGDLGFVPIQTSLGRLGVLVCWDQWFPEAARLMAMAGAELLIYPTAIGWDPADSPEEQRRQQDAWQTIQRGHAIANGLPLVAVNRCGFETAPHDPSIGQQFWGHSFVAGPQGEILAQAGEAPEHLTQTIDLSRSAQVRRVWPYFRDRRNDAYQDLTQKWGS